MNGTRYRLVVRLTAVDVGQRVIVRWLKPGPDDSEQMTDVLGILEQFDERTVTVRKRDGEAVVIPRARALAGKVVPPQPLPRRRPRDPGCS